MSKNRIAGIYMIRNKLNGKVYIGQSVDLRHRFKRYRWAATTETGTYNETKRTITQAIRKDGIENFEFIPLLYGEEYTDTSLRQLKEIETIAKYNSDNPVYGYNESPGGEMSSNYSRTQSYAERASRAKSIYLYDTHTQNIMLYFGGAKAVGDEFGYGKDVMSHTVKRGSLFLNQYYLIPANYERRHKILEKLRVQKTENTNQSRKAQSHSANAFNKYEKVVKYIDKEAVGFFE